MGELGQAPRWGDLGRRAASAAVLAPIALACIWFGAPAYPALIALTGAGLAAEWAQLCAAPAWRWPGALLPALVLLAALVTALDVPTLGLATLAAGFILAWLLTKRPALAAGIVYVGLATVALIWLRENGRGGDVSGRANVLFLVLVVWASDIGAYASGRLLGGPKLAPSLSPGKTRSGAIGGLIAAVVVGQVAASLLSGAPAGPAAALAGVLGIATQAGDLLESGLKRHFGVKDSGRWIPGHGGLLDRLDGLLAAAPVACLCVLVGRGGFLWQ